MSFLFAKAKKKIVPEFTGLQIQTSVNVLPIPIVYGSPRTSMNIIYANGFHAVAQESGGKGKGLLTGGKSETTGYQYYATFIGALCEGEITDIKVVFDNQAVYTFSTAPQGRPMVSIEGAPGQAAWTYITDNWPDDAFSYKDTAYIGFPDYLLDSSATIPQLNFVIEGKFAGTCPLNEYTSPDSTVIFYMDADPAECSFDLLTNTRYGANFPIAFLDQETIFTGDNGYVVDVGDQALSSYCQAVGLGWSVSLNNSEPASSILDRWFSNLGVAAVWTGSILKFIPYWDTYVDTNPGWNVSSGLPKKYFRPYVTPVFDLTDVDFVQADQGDDPVIVSRIDVSEIKNVFRVDFRDRYAYFNNMPVEAKDEVSVDLYGLRVNSIRTADEFTYIGYASTSAQIQMQRSLTVRNTYTFRLGWQYCVLDPMDIVTLTEETLGLDEFPVRIVSIEEDEKGILTLVCEEFPRGSATATEYPRQGNIPPISFETNVAVDDVNVPVVFEPTTPMLVARGQVSPTIILGASGGPGGVYDENWGGCLVNVSNDDATYLEIGTITGPSRHGELIATLPAYVGANPDTVNVLEVDLSESNGALSSVTPAQAAAGLSVCAIVDLNGDLELVGYEVATLTAPNVYDLTQLYRGLYGTVACQHGVGSQILRVDNNVFEYLLPPEFVGSLVYFKLQSFNIWGQALQDLSDCVAYSYTPSGQGTDYSNNPIILALAAGQVVDLNSATATLDLNSGGDGPCAPITFTVDLGTS